MEEFPEILQLVCTYLNVNRIDYVIVEGVAVMYHGVPRTTVDIDFILQMEDEQISPFTDFLNSRGSPLSTRLFVRAVAPAQQSVPVRQPDRIISHKIRYYQRWKVY